MSGTDNEDDDDYDNDVELTMTVLVTTMTVTITVIVTLSTNIAAVVRQLSCYIHFSSLLGWPEFLEGLQENFWKLLECYFYSLS